MKIPKIKVCGLVSVEDAEIVNQYNVDYAGFILFYPKSKRHVEISEAVNIMNFLDKRIKRVAVTVSPDLERVKIIESAGFDFLQVHGELKEEILEKSRIPIIRAFNIDKAADCYTYEKSNRIAGYVFDGKLPGNGEVFDWKIIKDFERNDKFFMLAGGLDINNVEEGIRLLSPDIVDVSSSVEKESGRGKEKEKVHLFVNKVRSI